MRNLYFSVILILFSFNINAQKGRDEALNKLDTQRILKNDFTK